MRLIKLKEIYPTNAQMMSKWKEQQSQQKAVRSITLILSNKPKQVKLTKEKGRALYKCCVPKAKLRTANKPALILRAGSEAIKPRVRRLGLAA
eukprot:4809682-Heterocapsa_arctica.AAC.1